MTQQRGPHNLEKCYFHIHPESPLSAEESLALCVKCVTRDNQWLQNLKEDFHQIGRLTILEEEPKYDPDHQSGASFITFMRARVCGELWTERRKHLKSIPFPVLEEAGATQQPANNPLVDGLVADACQCEGGDDCVIRRVEVEEFKQSLPQLLACLTDKERRALELTFFEELKGCKIAKVLGVTRGRVSQLVNRALEKLKGAYLC